MPLQNLSISIDRWLVPPPPENNGSLYERLANHVPHVLSGEGACAAAILLS